MQEIELNLTEDELSHLTHLSEKYNMSIDKVVEMLLESAMNHEQSGSADGNGPSQTQ